MTAFDVIVDRRRPRRLRGGVRRGASRRARRAVHAVTRHRRAHAVQSGDRRHGEGPPGSRDRRARRADGRARSTRPAFSSSCSIAAADRPSGRRARRRTRRSTARGCGERSTREPNIEWLIGKAGRILVEHGRVVGLAMEDGDAYGCARAGRHDRHVPERADPHRRRSSIRRGAPASRRRASWRSR